MRNHQEHQQDFQYSMVSMDSYKNPTLETTTNNNHHHHTRHHVLPSPSSSSQDFNKNHHQYNTHISKKSHQDEGFIFKNPNSLSYPNPSPPPPSQPAQDFKKAHHQHNIYISNKTNEHEGCTIKNPNYEVIKNPNSVSCYYPAAGEGDTTTPSVEESGRERLKRHRVEMAGRVWIPDIWGHEDFLKDWIDCTVFDSSLGNKTIMSARAALIQEGRSTVRIENKC